MSGEVVHFTIPADNETRARKFYSSIFGWKMLEMPGTGYTMVSTGAVDDKGEPTQPGYVGGGIGKRGENVEHPVVTIAVDEISDIEKAVEKNGGQVLQKKQQIGSGGMGWTGIFKDSEGNTVALYQHP